MDLQDPEVVIMELRDVTAGYMGKAVLDGITLSFNGGINIILGPNGAGKTTLFRVCSGALKPYKGEVLINGVNIYKDVKIKGLIGYLPHKDGLISELTVRENLIFYAKVYNLTDVTTRVVKLAKELGIENLLDSPVSSLSHGQRRRAALIRVLLHDPQYLLLDEPSDGLDPLSAKNFRSLIKELSKDRVIIYSTHNLYEALELAENVVVINRGRVVFKGPLEDLRHFVGRIKFGLKVRGNPVSILRSMGYEAYQDGGLWVVEVKSEEEIGDIIKELTRNNVTVFEVKEIGNPLEDVLGQLGDKS